MLAVQPSGVTAPDDSGDVGAGLMSAVWVSLGTTLSASYHVDYLFIGEINL